MPEQSPACANRIVRYRRPVFGGWIIVVFSLLGAWAATPAAQASREIVLVTGEVLRATVVERTADFIVLRHPVLGELRVSVADIRTIDGRPVDPIAAPPTRDAEPARPEPRPATPPAEKPADPDDTPDDDETTIETIVRPPPKWESRLELGFTASRGSSEDLRLRVGWGATRRDHRHLLRLDSTVRYGTSRGTRTESAVTAGTYSEWKAPEVHWSVFLQGRGDYDEFQAWDYRLSGAGGLAYRLIEMHRHRVNPENASVFTLSSRFGLGGARRFGLTQGDAFVPEGLIALVANWKINDRMNVTAETSYFPDLASIENYRTLTTANWTVQLDRAKGLEFRIGLTHAYESESTSPRRNDLTAFAAIVLTF